MNSIIIEEYIIGAENIEVRYYIDGELFGRVANVPVKEYSKWALSNDIFGEKEVFLNDDNCDYAYVDTKNYTQYWRGWRIEEHLTDYLTENQLYITDIPLYCKLWYSLCTWCANAFGSPQIR